MKKLIIFTLLLLPLYAQYNIFVGDKIELNLKANVVKEEIQDAFKDFYMEELEDKGDSYKIVIRPKEPGLHLVRLEKSEIKIKVMPVSTNRQFQEELDEGKNLIFKEVSFPFYIFIFLAIGIFLITKGLKFNKKIKIISREEVFEREMEGEDVFDISFAFRKYLDSKFSTNFLAGNFEYDNKEVINILDELEGAKYHKKEIDIIQIKKRIMEIYGKIKEEEDV